MNTRILGRPLKRPRTMAPPTTTSARISAKYKVADRMTRFKKTKATAQKVPKSAISHYKEFGQFEAEKCMYINHEHWGSVLKLWYGISLGLAKKLTAFAKMYPGKSLEDPMIGPRTSDIDPLATKDNKTAGQSALLRLIFVTEGTDGAMTRSANDVNLEDVTPNPDKYRSMDAIAQDIAIILRAKYNGLTKTWLQEAQILPVVSSSTEHAYIQNLDDAEIHLYVNSMIKFQNVTLSDGASADKAAIDANPLQGRIFTAKGHYPHVDGDLTQMGDKTLDSFFADVSDNTGGITLLGHANTVSANDLGRISSIPQARELYGNQTVTSGTIHISPGAMKFHKTTFTLNKTFRQLAGVSFDDVGAGTGRLFGRHTMFGITPAHKHGEDTIKIGYNRDTDVGCYIKHKRIVHPVKTNYTRDSGVVTTTVVPAEFVNYGS